MHRCVALLEFKVILATLFRSIEFNAPPTEVKQMISPTLQPVVEDNGGFLPLGVSLAQY